MSKRTMMIAIAIPTIPPGVIPAIIADIILSSILCCYLDYELNAFY